MPVAQDMIQKILPNLEYLEQDRYSHRYRVYRTFDPSIAFFFRITRVDHRMLPADWKPEKGLMVAISTKRVMSRFVLCFHEVFDNKPMTTKIAIAYKPEEVDIARKDIYEYLANGITPVPTNT